MIKKFINKRYEKCTGINLVKARLKNWDGLSFDDVKSFGILEYEYVSLLKKSDLFVLDLQLSDVEYELKHRYIKNQNTNRDIDMVIITFVLSLFLLYVDDFKYEKIRDISLIGIAIISAILLVFLLMNRLHKAIDDSNDVILYYEFKKECLIKAIKIKSRIDMDSQSDI